MQIVYRRVFHTQVIERVKHEVEGRKPCHIKIGVFNIRLMRRDVDVRVEFQGRFLGNLQCRSIDVQLNREARTYMSL